MRILAIRGGGLASLAKPFAIDLTRDPLAGSGLFAITGETGAGKSTILDALCLALYGDYPRASIERREKVVDPSDVAIQVSDPRNILTRGAGEGFAEVEFIGVDGIAYRVRWAARRAHGKAAGKLQKVERTLERCDGTAVVAATIESVNAAVVERTGFTFEEFRRSVLLAQGEFDAFLLADDAQRAALLEKITGTEVYSRISVRVFEETGARETALALVEAQRQAIGVKTREELAGLEREEGEALALRERTTAELAALDALLASAARVADAQRAVALRTCEVEERDDATCAAEAALAEAKEDGARREAASRAVEAEIADLEPIWQAAVVLDDQIRLAESERLAAVQELEAAVTAETTARDALTRLQDERRDAETEQADVLSAHERDRRHAVLADRQAHICAELDACAALQRRVAEASAELGGVDREMTRIREQIAGAEAVMETDCDERARLANLIAARRSALEAMHPEELSHRDAELLDLDAGIGRALEAVGQRDRADAALREAEADAEAADAEEAAQREIAATARAAHAERTRAREELAHLADLADATLSRQAAHLRSVLVEGAPCPVCGATGHPFAHGEDAATEIAGGIRERRAALDREVADLNRRINEAETACSRAAARREQALRAAAAAQPQLAAAHAGLTAFFPPLRARLLVHGLVPVGEVAAATQEGLDHVRAACRAARSAVADDRRRARALADEIAAHDRRHAALRQTIEDAAAACEVLRVEISGKERSRAIVETRLAAWSEQISGKLDEIAPLLAAGDVGPHDVMHDVTAARRRIETLAAAYGALATRRERSVERLQTLASAIALAEKDVGNAAASRARREQELARRRAAVDAATTERAKLLGGAGTAAHREAALERQAVARNAQKAADARSAAAALTLAGLRSALEAARTFLTEARTSADAARSRLREAVTGVGADAVAAAALVEGSSEELGSYQARHGEIAARLEEVQKRLVLIAAARETDRQARARADALAGEIDLKRRELKVWQAVNAAVGQADGAKFRRFAQSVTLDHLVALANVQLAALNPRYRLGRSALGDLALEVIDRDMGDEIRSPRSLSGGERFLVSLALALALSGLEGRQTFVDTLFIDEGFGSLDGDTLDCAIGALESLQGQGRKVGVITHVAAMVEQIPVQVRVEKRGSGRSVVRIVDGGAGSL